MDKIDPQILILTKNYLHLVIPKDFIISNLHNFTHFTMYPIVKLNFS